MVDFSSNINFNSPEVKQKGQEQEDNSPTLFTKTQFTNSVMSALSKTGANSTQTAQFKQEAGSIFDQYDANSDSKWTQKESDQGGASALAAFYDKVNNAIKGITSTEGAQGTNEVGAATTPEQVEQSQDKFGDQFLNATPEQRAAMLKQEFADLKAQGYDITNISENGDMTIKNPDGTTGTINLFESMGIPPEIMAEANITTNNDNQTEQAVNNLSQALDNYQAQGFEPVGTPEQKNINGENVLVGTLQNDQGEQIKINLKTGEEIKE